MKYFVTLVFFFTFFSLSAQKKGLIEYQDDIIKEAKHELDSAMIGPEGALYIFYQKKNISGSYIMDLTIREKGEVATVFCVSNDGGNITSQNILKDYLQNLVFDFKMPKGKRYKFQYEFKFD
jgi:hypothetical protein